MLTTNLLKRVKNCALALFSLGCVGALPAAADDGPSISASLTGATDYVWRGYTQTDENPAIFVAATVSQNGFYAGAGAENVDFLGIDTEYDIWAGWAGDVGGDITLDVGVVRYGYKDAPSGVDLDTVELKVAASTTVGKVALGGAVHWSDDFFATEEQATYAEVNASIPINGKWSVSGAVARQFLDNDDASYTTWNAGASYALADNVSLDVRYIDTDVDASGGAADARVVAGFTVSL